MKTKSNPTVSQSVGDEKSIDNKTSNKDLYTIKSNQAEILSEMNKMKQDNNNISNIITDIAEDLNRHKNKAAEMFSAFFDEANLTLCARDAKMTVVVFIS